MRKTLIALLLPTLLLMGKPLWAQDEVVVLVEHWPPWLVAHDEDRQHITDGVAVNLLREVFRRMGLSASFRTVPWARALRQIEDGKADIIPVLTHTGERAKYMAFTAPLYTDALLLVTTSGADSDARCNWTRGGAMAGRTVGTVRDYAYGKRWEQFRQARNFSTVAANDDLTNLKKVAGGRLDYTVQFLSNLTSNIAESDIDRRELTLCSRPLEQVPLHVGISRRSPMASHVAEFNQALRDMKADGTYKNILGTLYRDEDPPLQLSNNP